MKLRSTLAGTAVLVTLLGAGLLPAGPLITSAHAQAAISINVFYDDLAQHGDWVSYRDRYVFVPADVRDGWRPYTLGHWVNTDRFGWTWVSDEPFGWATYHYGRWGYAEEIGWYWVPGTVWAPAWVSWKRTPEYVVWAPLPVSDRYDYDDADIRVNVSVGDIPDIYWVAVPAPQFLEVNLNVVVIKDRDRRERIVREAEFVGPVRVENNIVVNNVIEVNYIEQKVGRDVKTVEVRETNDPREAKSSDDAVVAVKERLPRERDAKPGKVSKLEDVKERQEKREKAGGDQGEEPGSAAVDQGDAEQGGQATEEGGTATDQGATAGTDENAAGATTPRKKKQSVEQSESESSSDTAASEGSTVDQAGQGEADDQQQGQKAKPKKEKAEQKQPEGTQGVIDEQDQSASGKADGANGKKVKRNKQKADQQPEGTQGAVDQRDANQKKQGQKAKRKKQPQSEQPEGTQGVIDQRDQGQQQGQKVKRKKAQQQGSADGSQSQGQGGQTGQASGGQPATEEVQP